MFEEEVYYKIYVGALKDELLVARLLAFLFYLQ